jgi:hypothetical protein
MNKKESVDAASMHPIVHTPGPWEAVRSLTCGHLRAAHNYQVDPREEWTDADLKLISAAPDLLTALNDLLYELPRQSGGLQARRIVAARNAIEKATGKPWASFC